MTECYPSLKIRLCEDEVRIYCSDYTHMENVLNEFDSFMEFLGSNKSDDYYNFVEDSQVEGLRDFLRSNGYPYVLYRGDRLIRTWKPETEGYVDGLTQISEIDMKTAALLNSNGYVTIEDLRAAPWESICIDTDLTNSRARKISDSAEKFCG